MVVDFFFRAVCCLSWVDVFFSVTTCSAKTGICIKSTNYHQCADVKAYEKRVNHENIEALHRSHRAKCCDRTRKGSNFNVVDVILSQQLEIE